MFFVEEIDLSIGGIKLESDIVEILIRESLQQIWIFFGLRIPIVV